MLLYYNRLDTKSTNLINIFFVLERRGVSQDVMLDIKIGIEAKNYEGVSMI